MIPPERLLKNLSRIGGLAVLAMMCCACASSRAKGHTTLPVEGTYQAIYHETTNEKESVNASKGSEIEQLSHQDDAPGEVRRSAPPTKPPMLDRAQRPSRVVQQTSHQEEYATTAVEHGAPYTITQCPPEPRWAVPCPNPMAPGMVGCQCETQYLQEKFPDEYLCDGGDRALPVHYDSYNRLGLDTEDTVAEYTDHHGRNRVKASNRVCVYAPRFSTVRTVSRPHEDSHLNRIADVGHTAGSNAMHTRLKPSLHVKQEMLEGVRVRSRAGGLESEQLQGDLSQTKRLAIHDKLINVYQDLNFVQFGSASHTDAARLNFGIQAGLVWTREEYPIIVGKTDSAMVGVYEAHAATIVGIDDKKSDKAGALRIVKLADKDTAKPGDVIEFTLRYDNLGPNAVHHVRIVDNLTPRLVYVDDSATSDRAGKLVVQDNGEGSLVLVWELTEPLPAKSGGVVTFKARVR